MWRWLTRNHQTLTGVGAMLVGVAALFVAWDQARVMRAQQHGAVVPVIQIDGFVTTTPDGQRIGLRIHNNGVGPAMIRSVQLMRDGAPADGFGPLVALMPEGFNSSWSSVTGRAMSPDGMVEAIVFSWDRDDLSDDAFTGLMDEWERWDARLCYCSVFERCWLATASDSTRAPVRQCDDPGEDVFTTFAAQGRSRPDPDPTQSSDGGSPQ